MHIAELAEVFAGEDAAITNRWEEGVDADAELNGQVLKMVGNFVFVRRNCCVVF
jgi:hypothetical protein